MSSIRYEIPDAEPTDFKLKFLYLTKLEYGNDWHSIPHYHPFTELLYISEGRGEFIIDSESFVLTAGDLVVINPYTAHTEKSTPSCPMKYYVFGIGNLCLDIRGNPTGETDSEGVKTFSPVFHNPQYYERTLKYIQLIQSELEEKAPYYELMAYHRLCCLLIPILRSNRLILVKPPETSNTTKEIIFAKQYIDKHYALDLSLDELAKKSFINKFHLIHYFTQAYGVSPIRYLNRKRLCEAKILLRTTDLNITAIANSVGFASSSFFLKRFRDANGVSPSEYRKSPFGDENETQP